MNLLMGLVVGVSGLFMLWGGLSNSEWFMGFRQAQFVISAFGRTGARIFYVVVGVVALGLSAFFFTAGFAWSAR
jgi:hypothetical protein